MRKLAVLMLLVAFSVVVFAVAGCSRQKPEGEVVTQSETSIEYNTKITRAKKIRDQQMVEDIDRALLIDKPSRLNELRVK